MSIGNMSIDIIHDKIISIESYLIILTGSSKDAVLVTRAVETINLKLSVAMDQLSPAFSCPTTIGTTVGGVGAMA